MSKSDLYSLRNKLEPQLDEEGHPEPAQVVMEEEQIPEANKISEEEIRKQKKLLADLNKALKDSEKDTAIRTFTIIHKDYNHRIVEAKPVEEGKAEGEATEEVKEFNSLNEIKSVFQMLEKVATNLIKYQAFKANAKLIKLQAFKAVPETESRLEDHDASGVAEVEVNKDASKPADKSKAKPADDKSKVLDKSAVEKSPEPVVHEETLSRDWNYESYRDIVNSLPEDKKSISSLLSACLINICEELEKGDKILGEANKELDQEDEFKYIFDEVFGEVASNNEYVERNFMSGGSESVFSKSAHKSMFSSAQRSRENWNQDVVLDMADVCSYASDCILRTGENVTSYES